MLTQTQIILVQESFAVIAPIAADAAELFYGRLFELDPSLKPLFKGNLKEQQRKLMQMLTAAVKGLDRLDRLVPVLEDLGRRHARYGVTDAHYDTVGAALLWTLGKGLGKGFTREVQEAWTAVYGLIATTMKQAAHATIAVQRVSDSDRTGLQLVPMARAVMLSVVMSLTSVLSASAQTTLSGSPTVVAPGSAATLTVTGPAGQFVAIADSSVGAGMAYGAASGNRGPSRGARRGQGVAGAEAVIGGRR